MNISLLRINKSTAKRVHIILLLPFIMYMTDVKSAVLSIILSAAFTILSYAVYILCKKYLSIVVAYPISITLLAMLIISLSRIPDFWGFSFACAAIPSLFFVLYLYKYIGAVREENKVKNTVAKFSLIGGGALLLSVLCELASQGTVFDLRIHNYPMPYFSTYSGVFFILSLICAVINTAAGERININRSFNMKKGSIRLISYSAITALAVISVYKTAEKFILTPLGMNYLYTVIVCFLCGISFVLYRLLDKKIHIGKHAANFIPSLALLFCISVSGTDISYTQEVIKLVIMYAVFVCSVYICEIIATRKSVTDVSNPFAGAPSAMMIFSIASLVLESIKTAIL